ncbi:hypothetical protein OH77DRAFT_767684 [Trametes cingulata]|nr:hypothetical protein OH77DRAFT_767684 [Trametes cingulata]
MNTFLKVAGTLVKQPTPNLPPRPPGSPAEKTSRAISAQARHLSATPSPAPAMPPCRVADCQAAGRDDRRCQKRERGVYVYEASGCPFGLGFARPSLPGSPTTTTASCSALLFSSPVARSECTLSQGASWRPYGMRTIFAPTTAAKRSAPKNAENAENAENSWPERRRSQTRAASRQAESEGDLIWEIGALWEG